MAKSLRYEEADGKFYANNIKLETPQAALTAQLTTLTHTAPAADDFAIQDLVQSGAWGFADHHEANTFLKVIANLQARIAELEARLQAIDLLS